MGKKSAVNAAVARVALLVFSLALAFGVAEIALRLLAGPGDGLRGLHQAEPEKPWLYSLRPGAETTLEVSGDVKYRINEDGYRGPLASQTKPSGTQRILVLGDSVAFGYGVADEDTFSRKLEARGGTQRNLEVLNFGVGGFNPYNEAGLLEGKGAAFDPDVVLVQFCINDLNDPTSHFDAQTRLALGEIPDAAYPNPAERSRHGEIAPRSCWTDPCACSRLCSAVQRALFSATAPDGSDPPLDLAALQPRELPPGTSRRWLGDLYERMQRTAQDAGARFAVVVFPYRDQVEGDASARVQEQLRELAEERGFEVIDLLPAFQAAPQGEALFLDAWHPTPRGHALAAKAINSALQSDSGADVSSSAP